MMITFKACRGNKSDFPIANWQISQAWVDFLAGFVSEHHKSANRTANISQVAEGASNNQPSYSDYNKLH